MTRRMGLNSMATRKLALSEGETLFDALLEDGVALASDCGGTLACASCRGVVLEGLDRLSPARGDELDMLDRSCASAPGARLACQTIAAGGDIVVEIPSEPVRSHATASPIRVSERAASHLRAQLAKHPGAFAVRLAVEPSGCSGYG